MERDGRQEVLQRAAGDDGLGLRMLRDAVAKVSYKGLRL
jgi:hypothetical protein